MCLDREKKFFCSMSPIYFMYCVFTVCPVIWLVALCRERDCVWHGVEYVDRDQCRAPQLSCRRDCLLV